MLKCVSVSTYEIDSPEIALEEIKKQLDEKETPTGNAVGIIMCHTEFIETGVLKFISENLPFDTVGITTASQAVNDEAGEMILTLFVMVSDDIRFKAGITEGMDSNIYDPAKAAYAKAAQGETEPPGLILAFAPYNVNLYSGDAFVRAWRKIVPDVPVFGTVAADDTLDLSECETIYNGKSTKNEMPFVLCYGSINPRFLIATLPESTILTLRGKVTKSKDNIIYEVNGISTREFFMNAQIPDSLKAFPLMISSTESEASDKVPIVRELFSYNEDGAGTLGGDVKEGSTFTLLSSEPENIKMTSKSEIERIGTFPDVNGAIMFSCASRRVALLGAGEDLEELKIAKDILGQDVPFMMGYSGGEICPTSVKDGVTTNRFHNYTLVILLV